MSNGPRSSGPVFVAQTYSVPAKTTDDAHFEIHTRRSFVELTLTTSEPCRKGKCSCRVFWTLDPKVYGDAIEHEGQNRRCVFLLRPGTRGNGGAIDVATAITTASNGVAA